jgi:hypothetical protein
MIFYKDKSFCDEIIDSLSDILSRFPIIHEDSFDDVKDAKKYDESSDKDAHAHKDIISSGEHMSVFLNDTEDFEIIIPYKDIPSLVSDIDNAILVDNLYYYSNKLFIIRVETPGHHYRYSKSHIPVESNFIDDNGNNYSIRHEANGLLHFSLKLYQTNKCDSDFPSADWEDTFIVIEGKDMDVNVCQRLARQYMFFLSKDYCIDVIESPRFDPRPFYEEFSVVNESVIGEKPAPIHIDSSCEIVDQAIQLYQQAISCPTYAAAIIFYVKVMEFVSVTVLRLDITENCKKILSSPRAHRPDANYVRDLQDFFDKNRERRKDNFSIKMTIQRCCFFKDLSDILPLTLRESIKNKNESDSLAIISDAISSTRNQIAHAKANYKITGKEIGPEEYEPLANLLKIVSMQVLVWFINLDAKLKVG